MKTNRMKSIEGYAMSFLAAALAILIALSLAGMAEAGGVCRIKKVQRVVDYDYHPKEYFRIGERVRTEALATYDFRKSDEYQELRDLRVYREAMETAAIIAQGKSGDRPSGPPQPALLPAATEGDLPTPPTAPVSAFAARYPTLAANCLKCHTGDSPKGDVFLDGTVPLDGPDAAAKRDAIATAIVNLKMPKSKPLDDQHQYNALVELFSEAAPDTTSPNEGDTP